MANRMSDVKRGGELKFALDNYVSYQTNMTTRQTKRLKGGSGKRRPMVIVGVYPFSVAPSNKGTVYQEYLVKFAKATFDATGDPAFAKAKADNYYDKTPSETAKAIEPSTGFRPAQLITFHPTNTTGTIDYVQSKFTKLYYPKREGTRYGYPIGRLRSDPGAEDERGTKDAIKRDLVSLINAVAGRSVSFRDEKMGGLE